MGMQLVPEGGRATLPSPGTDIFDSMWYGQMFYDRVAQEVATDTFSGPQVYQVFNTKAKRKLQGNAQELKIYAVPSDNVDYTITNIGVVMLMLP